MTEFHRTHVTGQTPFRVLVSEVDPSGSRITTGHPDYDPVSPYRDLGITRGEPRIHARGDGSGNVIVFPIGEDDLSKVPQGEFWMVAGQQRSGSPDVTWYGPRKVKLADGDPPATVRTAQSVTTVHLELELL